MKVATGILHCCFGGSLLPDKCKLIRFLTKCVRFGEEYSLVGLTRAQGPGHQQLQRQCSRLYITLLTAVGDDFSYKETTENGQGRQISASVEQKHVACSCTAQPSPPPNQLSFLIQPLTFHSSISQTRKRCTIDSKHWHKHSAQYKPGMGHTDFRDV